MKTMEQENKKTKKQKSKKIIYFIFGLFFCFLVFLFSYKLFFKTPPEDAPAWDATQINFSRISFFNANEHRASLAIPDYWEGRYRIKDSGGSVEFLNIDDPEKILPLFSIKYIVEKDLKSFSIDGWTKLESPVDGIFIYKLSTASNDKNKEYNKMLKESSLIIKSFKAD
jgi:hypothetical protein